MIEIKAGHILRLTSWENDGDDYRTVELQGLTLEEVKFYVEVGSLFTTVNDPKSCGFGNSEDFDNETIYDAVYEIAVKHKAEHLLCNNPDDIYSWVVDKILGNPVQYEWGFYRVFESFKVYFNQKEIKIPEISL